MTTQTIPYPSHGLTLRAPNWLWVALANNRVENRGQGVATQAAKHKGGMIAITSSKETKFQDAFAGVDVLRHHAKCGSPNAREAVSMIVGRTTIFSPFGLSSSVFARNVGHIVCVAELLDVAYNGDKPGDYWAIPGQWGLRLGRVWLVEPVPCTGGQGFWRLGRCGCGRPRASTAGPRCRACEPVSYPDALTVRACYGAKGEEL